MAESDDIRRLLDEGLSYYGLGRVEEALEVWRRVLLLDPANQRAREYIRFVQENWAPGTAGNSKPYRPDKGSDPTLEVAALSAQAPSAPPAQTSPTLTDSPPLATPPGPDPAPGSTPPAPAWQTQPSYTPPARPILSASQWGDLFDIPSGSPAPPLTPPAPPAAPVAPAASVPMAAPAPPPPPAMPAFALPPPPPAPKIAEAPAADRILSSTLPARPAPVRPEPVPPPQAPPAAEEVPVPPVLFAPAPPVTPPPTGWSLVPKTEPRARLEIPVGSPPAPAQPPEPVVAPAPPGIPVSRPSKPPAVASMPPSALDLIAVPPAAASIVAPPPAEPERPKDREQLLRGVKDLLDLDDFTGALELADKVLQQYPGDARAQAMRQEAEQGLTAILTSKLGDLQAVPRVRMSGDEIIWLNLDHRAGFVLSLVDGNLSYDEILSICGLPTIEGLRILANLLQDKVIENK